VPLVAGQATVPLSRQLSVGRHTVVAEYQDGVTNAAGTSAPVAMTVTKAPTGIKLSRISSTADAVHKTVQVKVGLIVHIVGSSVPPQGKVAITVNGHVVRAMTITAANAGSVIVTLPAFSNKTRTATIRAFFMGSTNLQSASTSNMLLHLA
jgi:aerobic-type carbon monoxide dehydrogenase small subunit (CoxS/CutS family)